MDDQLTDQELVAFLDGEIAESERATIEQRIANEPELGQRLDDLRATWQLLDHLSPTEPTDDFTKTTVTMTAVRSRRGALSRFARRRWKTLAGVFAGLAAGYGAVFLPLQYEQQKRLRDVPVIDNVDLYLHAESMEFLRQLDSEELFAQDIDLDEELDNVL
jgi:anti-sigma factor RsiW